MYSPEVLDNIETLLLQKPGLFTEEDGHESIPMFEALNLDASMLFRVINLLIPTDVVERL